MVTGNPAATPTIRAATADDVPELARLRWQLYTDQGPHDESYDAYIERFSRFADDALAHDDWHAWVAEDGGRLIAAMWLQSVQRVPAPGTW